MSNLFILFSVNFSPWSLGSMHVFSDPLLSSLPVLRSRVNVYQRSTQFRRGRLKSTQKYPATRNSGEKKIPRLKLNARNRSKEHGENVRFGTRLFLIFKHITCFVRVIFILLQPCKKLKFFFEGTFGQQYHE